MVFAPFVAGYPLLRQQSARVAVRNSRSEHVSTVDVAFGPTVPMLFALPVCCMEKYCPSCKRYMSAVYFDSSDVKGRYCACIRKTSQPKVRATREDILTEVEIATDHDNDTSFENMFHRVTDQINDVIEHFKLKDR